MAQFACIVKLGSRAYGARHAKVRPSVMQCVLAVRETVVIKLSRLNIVAQVLSNSIPHSVRQASALVCEGGTCHLVMKESRRRPNHQRHSTVTIINNN